MEKTGKHCSRIWGCSRWPSYGIQCRGWTKSNKPQPCASALTVCPIRVPSYSDSFLPTLSLQSQQLQPRVPSDIYFHTQTPSSSHMKELACFIRFLWAYNTYEATLHFILLWIDPWKYWSISLSLLSPRFLCDIVCSCGCWGTHMSTVVKVTAWLLPRHEHCLYVFKMTQARHAPKCQRSFVIEVNWRVYPFIFSS